MIKTEVIKLLAIITAAHPKFEVNKAMIELWHELLGDIDYETAELAVKTFFMQNSYIPTIADIRKQSVKITCGSEVLSAGEAWAEIKRAISHYGYVRPDEARETLGPTLWQSVQYMGGWQELCHSTEPEGVLRGHFIKLYEQQAQRLKEDMLLPTAVKQLISGITKKMELPAVNNPYKQ